MATLARTLVILTSLLVGGHGAAGADEAPIAGTLRAVDTAARTITVESAARGRVRTVVIEIPPTTKIVRFTRSPGAPQSGFSEQALGLEELKPGWMVSVKTRHEGQREVAEYLRVVYEK